MHIWQYSRQLLEPDKQMQQLYVGSLIAGLSVR